jgi:hypothetical protein
MHVLRTDLLLFLCSGMLLITFYATIVSQTAVLQMKCLSKLLIILFTLFFSYSCFSQTGKTKKKTEAARPDSVVVLPSQRALFVAPKKNLLTTHLDAALGPSKVYLQDNSGLGLSITAKGLYAVTGAIYVNFGSGITTLKSAGRNDSAAHPGEHRAAFVNLPLGVGFTMGDDRAMIINGIDVFPVYFLNNPAVQHERKFSWGAGMDLGFHIRIKQRLHLGMMGKVQFVKSFDKDDEAFWPRFMFAGGGIVVRYD